MIRRLSFRKDPAIQEISMEQRVNEHYRSLYQYAYRLTGNAPDAEDLTQDTFLRAYRGYHTYDPARPFRQWLFRIAHNTFIDGMRGRRYAPSVSLDVMLETGDGKTSVPFEIADSENDPQRLLIEERLDERLETALRQLPDVFRSAILLCDVQGMSYEEVGQVQRCSLGTVRSRIHRGRQMLRKALTKNEEPDRFYGLLPALPKIVRA